VIVESHGPSRTIISPIPLAHCLLCQLKNHNSTIHPPTAGIKMSFVQLKACSLVVSGGSIGNYERRGREGEGRSGIDREDEREWWCEVLYWKEEGR